MFSWAVIFSISIIEVIKNSYHVRFQVLTATSMKFRVFWDVAPCIQVDDRPDDGGSMHLCNVSEDQLEYIALHPRRL
jgi:hypothetical protein